MHELQAGFGRYSDNDLGGSVEGPGKSSSMQDVAAYAMSMLTNAKYWEYITATSEDGQRGRGLRDADAAGVNQ